MRLHDMQEIPQYDNCINLGGTGTKGLTWKIGCCFQTSFVCFSRACRSRHPDTCFTRPKTRGGFDRFVFSPAPDGILAIIKKLYGL